MSTGSPRPAEAPSGPVAGLCIDARGLVRATNPALRLLVSAEDGALEGQPFDSLLTAPSRVLYQSYLQPLLRMHGNVEEILLTLRLPGSQAVEVLFYSARHGDATGEALIDVVLAPIRRRRLIDEQLLRMKLAADQSPGIIFQLLQEPDGTTRFPYVSEAVRRLYGSTPEQAQASARALFDRIEPQDLATLRQALATAADRREDWQGSYRVQGADGSLRWHEMQCSPREMAGGLRVWHGHIADVTARRALEANLAERTANDLMNQARSEFLARVSHELRTPLNGILGFTQLLATEGAEALSEVQRSRLEIVAASGRHLLQLVDQVLDISSIEAVQRKVELVPLSLAAALAQAVGIVSTLADGAGVDLRLQPPADAQWQVMADELRLRQVLVNLLSNAIKYNRPGGQVAVRAWVEQAWVCIAVADTGLGLTPEQQAELFQPFNRLGAERSSISGSGLGLVITRHLATLMGGSLEVHSEPGVGSTFTLRLALHGGSAETPVADTERAMAGPPAHGETAAVRGRVLCVEDNPVNAMLMEAVLGMRPGIDVRMVVNGAEALAALEGFEPDLLLLDMHLPDMLGSHLLGLIRERHAARRVPAIVISAAARPEDVQQALVAGFDDYWTKPLDVDRTLSELDRWLEGGSPA